jgi:hypothetical protein
LLSSITPLKARALLDKICKAPKDPVEPCDLDAVHTFGLINLLVWDNTANPAKITSTWFVYHPKSSVLTSWSQADLTTRNRLYGAHTVALMMVQVHAPTKDLVGTYTIGEKKRVLENTQSLQSLISLAGLGAPAGGGFTPPQGCNANGCDMFGGSIVTLSFDAADLTIKSTVGPVATPGTPPAVVPPVAPVVPGGAPVPVIPAPGAPVPAPAVAAAPGAAPVAPPALLPVVPPVAPAAPGGTPVPVIPAPGAPAPAPVPPVAPAPGGLVPVVGSQPLADANAGTQTSLPDFTAINEAKQWWDISIAIPIKKVSELQLNSVNNTLAPTNINRQNAFAVLDLFPIKRDLVGAAPTLVPHPLIGVSLASQPLHTILAALGMGFSYGDLYVGAILQKSQDVTGLAAGSTATPAQLAAATSYTYKPQFSIGINVSIKGALSALKK